MEWEVRFDNHIICISFLNNKKGIKNKIKGHSGVFVHVCKYLHTLDFKRHT